MQLNSDKQESRVYLLIDISKEEKTQAKAKAKEIGMTLQGWLAKLVREELKSNKEEANGQERT